VTVRTSVASLLNASVPFKAEHLKLVLEGCGAGTNAERLAVLSKLLANNEKACEYLVVACRRPPESQGFLLPLRRSYSTRGRLLAVVLILLHALPHVASAERPFLFEAASPAAARKEKRMRRDAEMSEAAHTGQTGTHWLHRLQYPHLGAHVSSFPASAGAPSSPPMAPAARQWEGAGEGEVHGPKNRCFSMKYKMSTPTVRPAGIATHKSQ